MTSSGTEWENYEQVASYLLDRFASEFGLERVEGRQSVHGVRSSTDWEIDAKGVTSDGEGFVIVECRRYTTTRQSQERLAALAYRISDAGASGGILVSPLGFQDGARKVAEAERIQEVILGPDSTNTIYMLKFLNKMFVGIAEEIKLTDSVSVTIVRGSGSQDNTR